MNRSSRVLKLTPGVNMSLAAVGALGSLAIHMFVPAMPQVATDLHASPAMIEFAVTIYLIGLGTGQLVAGPISDRIGRRPVLIGGLILFTLAAAGCALASSAWMLLAFRAVQALGAAAGILSVRAIVADLSENHEVAAKMAALMAVLLISPAISPLIGGLIASSLGGWRVIFAVLALWGATATTGCYLFLPETAVRYRDRDVPVATYFRLLRNSRFLCFAGGIACSSCALYIFLAASPFLFVDRYGMALGHTGICYIPVACASIAATFLVGRVETLGGAFWLGLASIVIGAALLVAIALARLDNPVTLVGAMMFVGFGCGLAGPAGLAGAIRAEEGAAGTSASLAGALQMIVSGGTASLIARLSIGTPLAMAIAILAVSAVGLMLAQRGRAV